MSSIHINDYSKTIASSFNALSRRQLLRIMPIMHGKEVKAVDAIATYTLILLGIPSNIIMSFYWLFKFSEDDKLDCSQFCEFLFKPAALSVNKVKKLVIYRWFSFPIVLHGPLDELKKLCFLEFIKADSFFLKHIYYHQGGDLEQAEIYLNKMVAVLYRPKKKRIDPELFNGDVRQVYNDDLVDQRISVVSCISLAERQGIALYYAGSRELLIKRYTHLFNSDKSESSGGGWVDALYAIAGNALQMKAAGKEDAALILDDLNRKIKLQKENEK